MGIITFHVYMYGILKKKHKEPHALNNNNDLVNCFKKTSVKLGLLFCE